MPKYKSYWRDKFEGFQAILQKVNRNPKENAQLILIVLGLIGIYVVVPVAVLLSVQWYFGLAVGIGASMGILALIYLAAHTVTNYLDWKNLKEGKQNEV